MRKIKSLIFLALCLALQALAQTEISTAAQLAALATSVNNGSTVTEGASYVLTADISLSGYANWTPIGTADQPFKGVFDGNGKKITGLKITGNNDYRGLFGYLDNATIKNLGVEGAEVRGWKYVGGIAGYMEEESVINNSYVTGTVSGGNEVGGIVGHMGGMGASFSEASLTNSYSEATVTGASQVGGIAGSAWDGSFISNCNSTGTVTGLGSDPVNNVDVGGIAGNACHAIIENCHSTGAVSGVKNVGGIAGSITGTPRAPDYNEYGTRISNSYSTGTVSGTDVNIGGIAGLADAFYMSISISGNFSTGAVSGKHWVGGIAGRVSNNDVDGKVVTMSNNIALNISIECRERVYGELYGRVAGYSIYYSLSYFYDNFAIENMLVIVADENFMITNGTKNNRHGENISLAELQSKLPRLSELAEIPWHLEQENASLVEAATGIYSVTPDFAENAEQARNTALSIINAIDLGEGVSVSLSDAQGQFFVPAIPGTEEALFDGSKGYFYIYGTAGYYKFNLELTKGPASVEITRVLEIVSVPYNFGGGYGSERSPYLIADSSQLRMIATIINDTRSPISNLLYETYADKHYKLVADLDLSGYENWNPIGRPYGFRGVFNGNGKKITGLKITGNNVSNGLFSYLKDSRVENLGIEGADVSGEDEVGGIAGRMNNSVIINSYVKGRISGEEDIGGIAGSVSGSSITGSRSEATVSGLEDIGGIAGGIWESSISDCHSKATVSGEEYIGGIAGYIKESAISNCHSEATVSGEDYVGGIAGYILESAISDCHFEGNASGESAVGGIAGLARSNSVLSGNIATGNVIGESYVGCIAGWYDSAFSGNTEECTEDRTPIIPSENRITLKDIPPGAKVEVYNLSGKRMNGENLPKGVYIIKSNNKIFKTVK
jgi:hypothetical protein